jgi:flagellar hook-basal body complex protein FliE
MTVNVGAAAAAYARNAKMADLKSMEPDVKDPSQNFGDLVSQAVSNAMETGKISEEMSAKAIAGKADLREVVTAVTNAEVTMQTAIAIRDRVVQAYKDIASMPI